MVVDRLWGHPMVTKPLIEVSCNAVNVKGHLKTILCSANYKFLQIKKSMKLLLDRLVRPAHVILFHIENNELELPLRYVLLHQIGLISKKVNTG